MLVAINTRLTADEVAYILDHSGARIVVVDPSLAHLVRAAPRSSASSSCGEGGDYEEFLASRRGRRAGGHGSSREEDTISDQLHQRHHRAAEGRDVHASRRVPERARRGRATRGSTRASVYLWTLPMFHCNGWCFTWAVTAVGGTHVCLRKVDPPLVWRLLDEEGVTHLCGAPTVLVDARRRRRGAGRSSGRCSVTTAGAPPPPARDRAHRGARRRDQPPLRPDRDLRADHDLRVEPGVGRARRGGARPAEGAPGRATW